MWNKQLSIWNNSLQSEVKSLQSEVNSLKKMLSKCSQKAQFQMLIQCAMLCLVALVLTPDIVKHPKRGLLLMKQYKLP